MEIHCFLDCEKSIFECDSCTLPVFISNIFVHDCKFDLKNNLEKCIQDNIKLKIKLESLINEGSANKKEI